jgi:hypothetical protein
MNVQVLKSRFQSIFSLAYSTIVDRRLGNTWELAIHKIHETMTMTLCNSKPVNMGATRIEEQSVKTTS